MIRHNSQLTDSIMSTIHKAKSFRDELIEILDMASVDYDPQDLE